MRYSFVTLATCSSPRILEEFACTRLAVSPRSEPCSHSEHPPWSARRAPPSEAASYALGPGRCSLGRIAPRPDARPGRTGVPKGDRVYARQHFYGIDRVGEQHCRWDLARGRLHQRLARRQRLPRGIEQRELGFVVRPVRQLSVGPRLQPQQQVRPSVEIQALVRGRLRAGLPYRTDRPHHRPQGCSGRRRSEPGRQEAQPSRAPHARN